MPQMHKPDQRGSGGLGPRKGDRGNLEPRGAAGGRGSCCHPWGSCCVSEPGSPQLRNRDDVFLLVEAAHTSPSPPSHGLDRVLGSVSKLSPSGECRASHPARRAAMVVTVHAGCRREGARTRGGVKELAQGGARQPQHLPPSSLPPACPQTPPDPGHDHLSVSTSQLSPCLMRESSPQGVQSHARSQRTLMRAILTSSSFSPPVM